MSRRAIRVVHVITRLDLGGAQQNTLYCVAHHDRARFEPELLAGAGGLLDEEARAMRDARVRLVPWLVHPLSPGADLGALFRLRAYFAARAVDVVHTHSSKAGVLGRLAAHLAGVPLVVHTVHGWSFNDTQPRAVRRLYVALERLAAAVSHRIVTVSQRDRDRGLRLGIGRPEQYEIVRSGIDVELYRRPAGDRRATRRALGLGPEAILVGSLSCLKPQKAPIDFVRAAAEASKSDPRLRFLLAGDGPLRPEVEREIARLGLHGKVLLPGWRADVPDLLQAMDLFLLNSRFEGLPRAVLQAMAAGVPVVATAVDGTPEVVLHRRTGLLVPPGRPRDAAEALLELLRDATLRRDCVEGARRRLTAEFEIGGMVRRLDRLYLEGLERRAAGAVPAREAIAPR